MVPLSYPPDDELAVPAVAGELIAKEFWVLMDVRVTEFGGISDCPYDIVLLSG